MAQGSDTDIGIGPIIAGMVGMVLLYAFWPKTTTATEYEFVAEVTVLDDENGAPIEGARVIIGGVYFITDVNGMITLGIDAGTYDVVVDCPGYEVYTGMFVVE